MGLIELLFKPQSGWKIAAKSRLVYDKIEAIKPYIKGRRVLDAGCGDDSDNEGLHAKIAGIAGYCVGVERDSDKARIMQSKGFNIVEADVQSMDLKERFDAVFAGELLEHLSNPGMFLDNAARHLNDGGIFIATTPSFYFSSMLIRLLFKRDIPINPEHVCWFDSTTLSALLERHGFHPESIMYYQSSPRRLMNMFARHNSRMARTLMVIARKK